MKIGDVVQLKSGGPWMTITYIDPDNKNDIWCEWFTAETASRAGFHADALITKEEVEASRPRFADTNDRSEGEIIAELYGESIKAYGSGGIGSF